MNSNMPEIQQFIQSQPVGVNQVETANLQQADAIAAEKVNDEIKEYFLKEDKKPGVSFSELDKQSLMNILNSTDVDAVDSVDTITNIESKYEKIEKTNEDPYPNLAPFEEQMLKDVAKGDSEIAQLTADKDAQINEAKNALIEAGMTEDEAEAAVKELREKAHKEIQEQYEKDHPDYAKSKAEAQERFGDIEAQHQEAMDEALETFKADNPEPGLGDFAKDPEHPTEEEIAKYNEAHSEWQEIKDAAMKEAEEAYKEENEAYRCYSDNFEKENFRESIITYEKKHPDELAKIKKAIESGRFNNFLTSIKDISAEYSNNSIGMNEAFSNLQKSYETYRKAL